VKYIKLKIAEKSREHVIIFKIREIDQIFIFAIPAVII